MTKIGLLVVAVATCVLTTSPKAQHGDKDGSGDRVVSAASLRSAGRLLDAAAEYARVGSRDDLLRAADAYRCAGLAEKAKACFRQAAQDGACDVAAAWYSWLDGRPCPLSRTAQSVWSAEQCWQAGLLSAMVDPSALQLGLLEQAVAIEPGDPLFLAALCAARGGAPDTEVDLTCPDSVRTQIYALVRQGSERDAGQLIHRCADVLREDVRVAGRENEIAGEDSLAREVGQFKAKHSVVKVLMQIQRARKDADDVAQRDKFTLDAMNAFAQRAIDDAQSMMDAAGASPVVLELRDARSEALIQLSNHGRNAILEGHARQAWRDLLANLLIDPNASCVGRSLIHLVLLSPVLEPNFDFGTLLRTLAGRVLPSRRGAFDLAAARWLRLRGRAVEALPILERLSTAPPGKGKDGRALRAEAALELTWARLVVSSEVVVPQSDLEVAQPVRSSPVASTYLIVFTTDPCGFCEEGERVLQRWRDSGKARHTTILEVFVGDADRRRNKPRTIAHPLGGEDLEARAVRLVQPSGYPTYCLLNHDGTARVMAQGPVELAIVLELLGG
jgi:hypothetical protein